MANFGAGVSLPSLRMATPLGVPFSEIRRFGLAPESSVLSIKQRGGCSGENQQSRE